VRLALDTNVLAYAEGVNGGERRQLVLELLSRIEPELVVLPVQVLGELFNVLVRKAGRSRAEARSAIMSWRDAFAVADTTPEVLSAATDLATAHAVGIWDAVIVAVASRAGCRLLLTEDLHAGFVWGGVEIVSPFSDELHPSLAALFKRG
jgi:predicted nucleic acid-binding protein